MAVVHAGDGYGCGGGAGFGDEEGGDDGGAGGEIFGDCGGGNCGGDGNDDVGITGVGDNSIDGGDGGVDGEVLLIVMMEEAMVMGLKRWWW